MQVTTNPYQADPVLAVDDAAVEVGLSSKTLRRLYDRGEIEFIKLSERRIGIRRSELARFLNERAHRGVKAA